jgi:hypothetical protein
VVKPSQQHLSRGKTALSTIVTLKPWRIAVIAAAVPAGPAPTIKTSHEVERLGKSLGTDSG